jgi:CRISPR system Cascade subunit CasD
MSLQPASGAEPLCCLALGIDAPMQSWGTTSRFVVRDTASEPTKSGIVGLLAAASGVDRGDHRRIKEIAALRMAVRVDREGILERDYHTVRNVPKSGESGRRDVVSHRYYLADGLFLVVLHGDQQLLTKLHSAVQRPVWPLYFGRRAFPPARPLVASGSPGEPVTGAGLVQDELATVLANHPWLETRPAVRRRERARAVDGRAIPLRTVSDCQPGESNAEQRNDHPITFASNDRQFEPRSVRQGEVLLTAAMIPEDTPACS